MTIDQQHLQEHYVNALMRGMSWKCWNLLLRHRWNSNMNINTHILAGIHCALYIFINVTNTWNTVWNSEASDSLPQCARDETLPGCLDTCSARPITTSQLTHSPGCLPHNHCSILQPSEHVLPTQLFKLSGVICLLPCDAHSLHFPVNLLLCLIKSSFRAISCSLCLHLSPDGVISLQGPWHFMFLVCFEMQMSFWSLFC